MSQGVVIFVVELIDRDELALSSDYRQTSSQKVQAPCCVTEAVEPKPTDIALAPCCCVVAAVTFWFQYDIV